MLYFRWLNILFLKENFKTLIDFGEASEQQLAIAESEVLYSSITCLYFTESIHYVDSHGLILSVCFSLYKIYFMEIVLLGIMGETAIQLGKTYFWEYIRRWRIENCCLKWLIIIQSALADFSNSRDFGYLCKDVEGMDSCTTYRKASGA